MLKISEITTEVCTERVVSALSEVVGPGKPWTYERAAEALGIEYKTLAGYALGQSLPRLSTLLRMFSLWGPVFSNRVLRLSGLDGCGRQEAVRVNDFALNGGAAALIGRIGEALRDGHIDHRERAQILKEARGLQEILNAWVATNDAPSGDFPIPGTVDMAAPSDASARRH